MRACRVAYSPLYNKRIRVYKATRTNRGVHAAVTESATEKVVSDYNNYCSKSIIIIVFENRILRPTPAS